MSLLGIPSNLYYGEWVRVTASALSAFSAIYVYRKTKAMPKGQEWGWSFTLPTWFLWVLTATFIMNAVDSFIAANIYSLRHETFIMFSYGAFGILWLAGGLLFAYLTCVGFFKRY